MKQVEHSICVSFAPRNRGNALNMITRDGRHDNIETREVCYRCFKPKVVCICKNLVRVKNKTDILILQHKCEHMHPIGTARIAVLGLDRVNLRVVLPDENGRFTCAPIPLRRAGLLYPGEGARDLSALAKDERPHQLVVLDGSWPDARHLFRDNPWIRSLPRYSLTPLSPSRYRIRAEPSAEAISSIEAIVQSLQILEPETDGLESLIDVFDAMIDDQIKYRLSRGKDPANRRGKRPRQQENQSIPACLRGGLERAIIAYGESVPHPGNGRTLVSWAAVRPGDGELFERFIAPPPNANVTGDHLELMGLSSEQFGRAVDLEELSKEWRRFASPDHLLITWNRSTLDLFARSVRGVPAGFFLKAIYTNVTRAKCGHLHDVVRLENLTPQELALAGRAGRQVGQLLAVARFLLDK